MPGQIPSVTTLATDIAEGTFSRRSILLGSGAGALALALGGRVHAVAGEDSQSFAMVTDVHVNVEEPERTADLERILRHIEDRNPAFVLNCGDITDLGLENELETYLETVPKGLRSRMRDVPGNHEQQWLVDAFEAYEHHLGATRYSFDAAGLHVAGLDPLAMQEWAWYFDEDLLAWLDEDLAGVPDGTPIVVFLHFPLSHNWNYVPNGDDLLRVIDRYPVRAIFGGHTHVPSVLKYNGVTQVIGDSLKNGPYYYWAERVETDDGPALEVTEVEVPANGEVQEESFATVPLFDPGPGGRLGPFSTEAEVDGGTVDLHVHTPADAAPSEVLARVHPDRYGAVDDEWSASLDHGDDGWTGQVDVAELAPGSHRIQVRVSDGQEWYDDTVRFELPWESAQVAWTRQLDGRVQGALASYDDLVVVATTAGVVMALRPTTSVARIAWRRQVGPVYKGARFTPDGTQVLVPSTDHRLYALEASTGRIQRHTDVGAPIASDLDLAEIDGQTCVLFAGGATLFCVDLAGEIRWSADLHGVAAGRATCDGERVFMASGDGRAYAFDAQDGTELWSVQLTDQSTVYGQVLYGPWACHVALIGDDKALFTTFDAVYALDTATGAQVWSGSGDDLELSQLLYTPPTLTDHGILLMDGFNGTVHLFDAETGEQSWKTQALPRNFGAAPVPDPDDDAVYWLVGQSGLLIRIDLAEEKVDEVAQVLTSFTQSTAALLGSADDRVLVVGGQDGIVCGVTGLDS